MLDIKDCVTFSDYLVLSKESSNKVGILVTIFQRLHPYAPETDFINLGGRIAQLWAKSYKDTGYLLKIIWDTSSDNIAGSHLNYIQAILQKQNKINSYTRLPKPTGKLTGHAGMETD
jgi:hypothetical protein